MCVPTDFRRKMILKLIEALKESPSFSNISLFQIKEAVLNSEHQTFQQSKTKDEYLYFINEKMKKIQHSTLQQTVLLQNNIQPNLANQNPMTNPLKSVSKQVGSMNPNIMQTNSSNINTSQKFEFSSDNQDPNVEERGKIINGNIPSHIKISQMYSQDIPQQYSTPTRKMESFAASFDKTKRNLDMQGQYQGYQDNTQQDFNKTPIHQYPKYQNREQTPVAYDKNGHLLYTKSPKRYVQPSNNQQSCIQPAQHKHMTNQVPSPKFSYANSRFPMHQNPPFAQNNVEKDTFSTNYPQPYTKPVYNDQYQERPRREQQPAAKTTINRSPPEQRNNTPMNFQDNSKQNFPFVGFSPFVGRQPPSQTVRDNDPRMGTFMGNSNKEPIKTEQFRPIRNENNDIDNNSIATRNNTFRDQVEQNNAELYKRNNESNSRPPQPGYQRGTNNIYGQKEASPLGLSGITSHIKNNNPFEYSYANNKNTTNNRSFIGNVNPGMFETNTKTQSDKIISSIVGRPTTEKKDINESSSISKAQSFMFDEKKSEELFRSISEEFAKVGKKNGAGGINNTISTAVNVNEGPVQDSLKSTEVVKKDFSKVLGFDFNEAFKPQKKSDTTAENTKFSKLNNSLDSFIDSELLFPFKPMNYSLTSSEVSELEIPDELTSFLKENRLVLKEIKDEESWKLKFSEIYKKISEVKNKEKFTFTKIIETQHKFLNFYFIDENDINCYLNTLGNSKTVETTKEDYLMFIDRAIEAFAEKKDDFNLFIKDTPDAGV